MRVDKQTSRKQTARAGSAATDVPGERRAARTKLPAGWNDKTQYRCQFTEGGFPCVQREVFRRDGRS